MSKEENILVAGATGTTGKIIIDLLKKSENYNPIALVRKQAQKEDFESNHVKAVLGDLEEDVTNAVKDATKVIFAAGSGGEKVIAVDQEGAKRLMDASKKANVEKFVILSSLGAANPSQNEELEAYLKAKQNADHYLQNSGLEYSIVRPGELTNENGIGKIKLEKKLDSKGSIPRADVAATLVAALEDEVKKNEVFEIISGDVSIATAVRTS